MPDSKPSTVPNERRHFLKGSAATSTLVVGAAGAAALSAVQPALAAGTLDPAIYGANYPITDRPAISGSTAPQLLKRVTIPKTVFVGKTIVRVHATVSFTNSANLKALVVEHGPAGFVFAQSSNARIISAGSMSTTGGVVVRGEISMNTPNDQITYGWNSYSGYGLTTQFWSSNNDYSPSNTTGKDMDIVFWGQLASPSETMVLVSGLIEVIKG
jgi:hypothetical protein